MLTDLAAGFGYAFNSLAGESNELANAFGQLTSGGGGKLTAAKILISRVLGFLISYFPIARFLPNKRLQAVRNAFAVMESESKTIIATRRKEVEEAGPDSMAGKDLMSILCTLFPSFFNCRLLKMLYNQ